MKGIARERYENRDVLIEKPVFLAPMAGITDLPIASLLRTGMWSSLY